MTIKGYNTFDMSSKKRGSLEELCEQNSVRLTRQRRLLLSILEKGEGHVSAYSIFEEARKKDPTIGQATVYRTLKLLAEKGILDTHSFGSSENLFESLEKEHHDHLICTSCGNIEDLYSEDLEKVKEKVAKANRFKMESHRLDIYGICAACSSKKR